jgi:hypothetical protein
VQSSAGRSPTTPLYLGLVITLIAVVGYSWYVTRRIGSLRELQNNLIDRNRRDSLQLLRIQNELNSIGMSMRDMLDVDPSDTGQKYPLTAWQPQFERMRGDLEDAFERERQVSPQDRTPDQQRYLEANLSQFWDAMVRRRKHARKFVFRFRPAWPLSATRSRDCWCKTTKSKSEPPRRSAKFTITCRGRLTSF